MPLAAFAPVHPPDAVHEVSFDEDHARVEVAPAAMEEGLAVKLTEPVPGGVTERTAEAVAAGPPGPVQVTEYVTWNAELPFCDVTFVPLVASGPLNAQLPPAVHAVALVLDQPTVELAPETMVDGLSVTVTVGAVMTVTVADACAVPLTPLHDKV